MNVESLKKSVTKNLIERYAAVVYTSGRDFGNELDFEFQCKTRAFLQVFCEFIWLYRSLVVLMQTDDGIVMISKDWLSTDS